MPDGDADGFEIETIFAVVLLGKFINHRLGSLMNIILGKQQKRFSPNRGGCVREGPLYCFLSLVLEHHEQAVVVPSNV